MGSCANKRKKKDNENQTQAPFKIIENPRRDVVRSIDGKNKRAGIRSISEKLISCNQILEGCLLRTEKEKTINIGSIIHFWRTAIPRFAVVVARANINGIEKYR